jgi:hypothetical protein
VFDDCQALTKERLFALGIAVLDLVEFVRPYWLRSISILSARLCFNATYIRLLARHVFLKVL